MQRQQAFLKRKEERKKKEEEKESSGTVQWMVVDDEGQRTVAWDGSPEASPGKDGDDISGKRRMRRSWHSLT